jgi:hypothetical protein
MRVNNVRLLSFEDLPKLARRLGVGCRRGVWPRAVDKESPDPPNRALDTVDSHTLDVLPGGKARVSKRGDGYLVSPSDECLRECLHHALFAAHDRCIKLSDHHYPHSAFVSRTWDGMGLESLTPTVARDG